METQFNKLDVSALRMFLLSNAIDNSKTQEKSKENKEFKLGEILNKKKDIDKLHS